MIHYEIDMELPSPTFRVTVAVHEDTAVRLEAGDAKVFQDVVSLAAQQVFPAITKRLIEAVKNRTVVSRKPPDASGGHDEFPDPGKG